MLIIRTHAVTCFVVGRGDAPAGVEYHGPQVMFEFPTATEPALQLDRMVDEIEP